MILITPTNFLIFRGTQSPGSSSRQMRSSLEWRRVRGRCRMRSRSRVTFGADGRSGVGVEVSQRVSGGRGLEIHQGTLPQTDCWGSFGTWRWPEPRASRWFGSAPSRRGRRSDLGKQLTWIQRRDEVSCSKVPSTGWDWFGRTWPLFGMDLGGMSGNQEKKQNYKLLFMWIRTRENFMVKFHFNSKMISENRKQTFWLGF